MNTEKKTLGKKELEKLLDKIGVRKKRGTPTESVFADGSPNLQDVPLIDKIRREEKPRRYKLPLLLSTAFLSAFFIGSLFGFFWGKSQENTRLTKEVLARENEIFSLLHELKSILQKNDSIRTEKTECIIPLSEAKEPESLSQKRWI